ncbi:AI-2E family transporter [Planosporangium sp. 12N6]|uniref:AI-2E family transporter n=1 Tax=Planosporangium spinosum TaxID=3402278 RepID=UPI003CEED2D9
MSRRPAGTLAPPALLRAATVVACLLVLATGAYLVVRALGNIMPVTMAVVAALLLGALIGPVTERLKRAGLPDWAAALVGVLGLLVLVGGAVFLVGQRAAAQFGGLRRELSAGVARVRQMLTRGPLALNEKQIERYSEDLRATLRSALPSPFAGAATAAEVAGAVVLTLLLLFFVLRDGPAMWCWLVGCLPAARRERLDRAARAGWHSLSSYMHGIVLIAAVDAAGIGAALFALRVPLALSLVLLTFVAAFVPIAGATVAGAVATLVTFVTNGPRAALLVLAAVIAVQQAEGHLLHPIVMRRAVRLHPVVTLLAVGAGTLAAGIPGALVAVPVCAFVYHAVRGYRAPAADGGSAGVPHDHDAHRDRSTAAPPGGG